MTERERERDDRNMGGNADTLPNFNLIFVKIGGEMKH